MGKGRGRGAGSPGNGERAHACDGLETLTVAEAAPAPPHGSGPGDEKCEGQRVVDAKRRGRDLSPGDLILCFTAVTFGLYTFNPGCVRGNSAVVCPGQTITGKEELESNPSTCNNQVINTLNKPICLSFFSFFCFHYFVSV